MIVYGSFYDVRENEKGEIVGAWLNKGNFEVDENGDIIDILDSDGVGHDLEKGFTIEDLWEAENSHYEIDGIREIIEE